MTETDIRKPKLGFAGVGWIGRNRLEAIHESGLAEISSITDLNHELAKELGYTFPGAGIFDSYEDMLAEADLDGVVIATPSSLHAEHTIAALEKEKAVFCQKPLGRSEHETAEVVAKAKTKDLLLGVDFSYRPTEGMRAVKDLLAQNAIGEIYGINLTFHNAYGPDKAWYFNPELAGGGCLMDLGIHLADMLYWLLDDPQLTNACSQLFHKGKKIKKGENLVEDYAVAQLELNQTIAVQLACSWNLPAGKDAVIEAKFYGEKGGLSFHNINGSFYDFAAEYYQGTSAELLTSLPDSWSGRMAVQWAGQLADGNHFNAEAEDFVKVASLIDAIYQNGN